MKRLSELAARNYAISSPSQGVRGKARRWRKPPYGAGFSVKNSHTSVSRIKLHFPSASKLTDLMPACHCMTG